MQGHGVVQKESIASAEIDRKAVISGKTGRAEPGYQVEIGVIGALLTDEDLAGQYVVADVQIVIGVFPIAVRQYRCTTA